MGNNKDEAVYPFSEKNSPYFEDTLPGASGYGSDTLSNADARSFDSPGGAAAEESAGTANSLAYRFDSLGEEETTEPVNAGDSLAYRFDSLGEETEEPSGMGNSPAYRFDSLGEDNTTDPTGAGDSAAYRFDSLGEDSGTSAAAENTPANRFDSPIGGQPSYYDSSSADPQREMDQEAASRIDQLANELSATVQGNTGYYPQEDNPAEKAGTGSFYGSMSSDSAAEAPDISAASAYAETAGQTYEEPGASPANEADTLSAAGAAGAVGATVLAAAAASNDSMPAAAEALSGSVPAAAEALGGSVTAAADSSADQSPATETASSSPSDNTAPGANSAAAQTAAPEPEAPEAEHSVPLHSSSVKLNHYLGLSGSTSDADPQTYMRTFPATMLAILKFLSAVAAGFCILVLIQSVFPALSNLLQTAKGVSVPEMVQLSVDSVDAQLPALHVGALLQSMPWYDSVLDTASSIFTQGTDMFGFAAYGGLIAMMVFLAIALIDGFCAFLLRFAKKGATVIRITHLFYTLISAAETILAIALLVLSVTGIRAVTVSLPDEIEDLVSKLPVIYVTAIIFGFLAFSRVISMLYHANIAKAMKIVKHDLSTGARSNGKKTHLTLICILRAAFQLILLGSTVLMSSGSNGLVMAVPPLYLFLKYLFTGLANRSMMRAQ